MLEDAKNGLVFASEKEASIQATLTLLYGKTTDAQGQAARESDSYAAVTARLNAKFEDMSAEIGTALLPILTDFSEWLSTPEGEAKLQEIVDGIIEIIVEFTKAVDWVVENKDWLVPMVVAIGTITTAWGLATTAFETYKTAVAIAGAVTAAGVAATTVVGTGAVGAAAGGYMTGQVVGQTANIYSGGSRYEEGNGLFGNAFKPVPQTVNININNGNVNPQQVADAINRANRSSGTSIIRQPLQ
jgi:hypothetical protein